MADKMEEILVEKWNQSQEPTDGASPTILRHLIFGKLVYTQAIEDACRALCFNCRDGVKLELLHKSWYHQFFMADGQLATRELCKANAIWEMFKVRT